MAAGLWTEMKGTRESTDRNPDYREYRITFTAAAVTAPPTCGIALAAVSVASGLVALPDHTDLAYEPETVAVSKKYRVTPEKAAVTCIFRAPYSNA